jgi:hypothetical protein
MYINYYKNKDWNYHQSILEDISEKDRYFKKMK